MVSAVALLGFFFIALVWLAMHLGLGSPLFVLWVMMVAAGAPVFCGRNLALGLSPDAFLPSARARKIFRRLGVTTFGKFLTAIGWNRNVLRRLPLMTRADLTDLAFTMRASAAGHSAGWSMHAFFGTFCLVTGHFVAAVSLFGTSIFFHLYPVALQSQNLARIDVLQKRALTGATIPATAAITSAVRPKRRTI